ncbi:MAG: hypothetical protein ACFFAU_20075 [Candidatus Hodarchaeota archaeon]
MKELTLVHSINDRLNPALLISLLSSIFLQDFKIQEKEIVYNLKPNITNLESVLELYLTCLNELTETQFYFEFLSESTLLLRVYNMEGLRFQESLLFSSYPASTLED